jgi:ribonuclease HI
VTRRRPRRPGGTLKDGERRQLAYASRTPAARPLEPGPDRVHCDGGSRGNPGPAAIAAVLVTAEGHVAAQRSEKIGRATAAEAEYRAIVLGLELAAAHDFARIEVRSDSQLAIAGATQDDRIRAAAAAFDHVTWTWLPRAENGTADQLVRDLLWPPVARPPKRA